VALAVAPAGLAPQPKEPLAYETAERAGFGKADAKLLARHGFNVVRPAVPLTR
jgi:hypothetical protein